MELGVGQLVFGVGALLVACAWYLDFVTRCHGCKARLALRPTNERRVVGTGQVQREWKCKDCGWTDWKRDRSGGNEDGP